MPENKSISDAELAEVRRLHAAAGLPDTISIRSATIRVHPLGPDLCSSDEHEASLAALHNAFPSLLARLEAAERKVDELEAELEEARDNANGFEKDCKTALVTIATRLGFEWDGDGATADTLLEHVWQTVEEARRQLSGLAARDAQQRREGAAEWLENAAREGGSYERSSEGMLEEAKQLREGGE